MAGSTTWSTRLRQKDFCTMPDSLLSLSRTRAQELYCPASRRRDACSQAADSTMRTQRQDEKPLVGIMKSVTRPEATALVQNTIGHHTAQMRLALLQSIDRGSSSPTHGIRQYAEISKALLDI